MKEIELTQGLVVLIDDEDYAWLSLNKWMAEAASNSSRTHYAVRWMTNNQGQRRALRMHRLIIGAKPGQQVDHIDGDGLNNQRSNLRVATCTENQRNSRLRMDNTSGFKGVSWKKQNNRWQASIRVSRKKTHLGYFRSPVEAALAYDHAALTHFGKFARLNFPERNVA